jgi:hypothetical protein
MLIFAFDIILRDVTSLVVEGFNNLAINVTNHFFGINISTMWMFVVMEL